MEVSLYVPCYNAAGYLDRVIPAILSQAYPLKEIIIVNDGSRDNTELIAKKYPMKIINHKKNQGLGATRNTAVLAAQGDFIASLDADVLPDANWLKSLIEQFTDGATAGADGCLIETYKESLADYWRNTHMQQSLGPIKIDNPSYLFSSNTIFKKSALIEAGLYDTHCRRYGEDVYVWERLKNLNYRLVYAPEARCYHLRKDTLQSVLNTLWGWNSFSNWEDITLDKTWKQIYRNFLVTQALLRKDLKSLDLKNILMDSIYPFYSTCADWLSYFKFLYTTYYFQKD